jgi:hypothetical protein
MSKADELRALAAKLRQEANPSQVKDGGRGESYARTWDQLAADLEAGRGVLFSSHWWSSMQQTPQLPSADRRKGSRYTVDNFVNAEHLTLGHLKLLVVNISHMGLIVDSAALIGRGERLTVQLPIGRRLEIVCIWKREQQAGFILERRLSNDEFQRMLNMMEACASNEAA